MRRQGRKLEQRTTGFASVEPEVPTATSHGCSGGWGWCCTATTAVTTAGSTATSVNPQEVQQPHRRHRAPVLTATTNAGTDTHHVRLSKVSHDVQLAIGQVVEPAVKSGRQGRKDALSVTPDLHPDTPRPERPTASL